MSYSIEDLKRDTAKGEKQVRRDVNTGVRDVKKAGGRASKAVRRITDASQIAKAPGMLEDLAIGGMTGGGNRIVGMPGQIKKAASNLGANVSNVSKRVQAGDSGGAMDELKNTMARPEVAAILGSGLPQGAMIDKLGQIPGTGTVLEKVMSGGLNSLPGGAALAKAGSIGGGGLQNVASLIPGAPQLPGMIEGIGGVEGLKNIAGAIPGAGQLPGIVDGVGGVEGLKNIASFIPGAGQLPGIVDGISGAVGGGGIGGGGGGGGGGGRAAQGNQLIKDWLGRRPERQSFAGEKISGPKKGVAGQVNPYATQVYSGIDTDVQKGGMYDQATGDLQNLRDVAQAEGLSKHGQYLTDLQQMQQSSAADDMRRQQGIQSGQALDQLAMTGGASGGARERMLGRGDTNVMNQLQNLSREGRGARLGIAADDEARKLGLAQQLPGQAMGMEQYSTGLEGQNIAREMAKAGALVGTKSADIGRQEARDARFDDIDMRTQLANQGVGVADIQGGNLYAQQGHALEGNVLGSMYTADAMQAANQGGGGLIPGMPGGGGGIIPGLPLPGAAGALPGMLQNTLTGAPGGGGAAGAGILGGALGGAIPGIGPLPGIIGGATGGLFG